jgi:hypothetical protein
MNAVMTDNWHKANQRYLMARLAVVREALAHQTPAVGDGEGTVDAPAPQASLALEQAAQALPAPAALDALVATFGLSCFERDVLLLCAGVELDSAFANLCATLQGDPQHRYASFGLALAALPEAHWSALTPDAPLRRWHLVEVGAGDGLTASHLRIDERVLHYLAGVSELDERLHGILEPVLPIAELPPSHQALVQRLQDRWTATEELEELPIAQLRGSDPIAKRAVAATACAVLGLDLYALAAADVPVNAEERDTLLRLWEREVLLTGSALLLECEEFETPEQNRTLRTFLDRSQGPLVVSVRDNLPSVERPMLRLQVDLPTAPEQRTLWRQTLGPLASKLNGQLDALVSQFRLSGTAVHAASLAVLGHSGFDDDDFPAKAPADLGSALWEACRCQTRPNLADLAQRIHPCADWNDLVLPQPQKEILRTIAAHVRQRARVYEDWGFAARSPRGLGITVLFSGASGTGKTMAAEVLAKYLHLDLYRIDLSTVVSKYIGETEKHLRRVFDAAEQGGAMLLFDEADALFGKRSEVKDSHDRYANIEVSYLLQRMEVYRGLAILTTNQKDALDAGFLRRLRFVVQFPFPDAEQRAEIWRRIFPDHTPAQALDYSKLARLSVAGGNIRNIALNAAFLAADEGKAVGMDHLLAAAHSEYAKLEKSLSTAETRDWL